jgi:hypothetical protein
MSRFKSSVSVLPVRFMVFVAFKVAFRPAASIVTLIASTPV